MLRAPPGANFGYRETKMTGNRILNFSDTGRRDRAARLAGKDLAREREIDCLVREGGHGTEAGDGTFDLSNVVTDALGDKITDVVGELETRLARLGLGLLLLPFTSV